MIAIYYIRGEYANFVSIYDELFKKMYVKALALEYI